MAVLDQSQHVQRFVQEYRLHAKSYQAAFVVQYHTGAAHAILRRRFSGDLSTEEAFATLAGPTAVDDPAALDDAPAPGAGVRLGGFVPRPEALEAVVVRADFFFAEGVEPDNSIATLPQIYGRLKRSCQ